MVQKKVAIVGAGIAGLAAAKQLVAANNDVTIFEARERIGGRIWTSHEFGVPTEIGAFMFHGTVGNPLVDLAQKLNIAFKPVAFDKKDWGCAKAIEPEDMAHCRAVFVQILESAYQYAQKQPHDLSLQAAINAVFDEKTFPAFTSDLLDWFMDTLKLYMGVEPSYLSAQHWNEEEVFLEGDHCVVLGGYEKIIDYLAKDLKIHLNEPVLSITDRQQVEIKTQKGTYNADNVIVTIPMSLLKKGDIQFNPPLSEKKVQAMQHLDMALLNKIFIEFPERFWQKEAAIITTLDFKQPIYWYFNFQPYLQRPILMALLGGEVAKAIESYSDKQIEKLVMTSLQKIYGNPIPAPVKLTVTRWQSDPWSLGAYAYIPVGASGADYNVLAESVGRIHFAGEATEKRFPGTTNGAYISGVRAADEIMGNKN